MRTNSSIVFEQPAGEPQAQPVSEARAVQAAPEILYVMGPGRSGTTILEILLANNPGMSGVGELKHIFRDGFLRDVRCACGKPGRQCDLWSRVLSETEWNRDDCVRIGEVVNALESHSRFPLVLWGAADRKSEALYGRATNRLFATLGAVTQSRVIVDSSKYAGRALLLAKLFPGRVKVLCITRGAAGLIASFGKKNDLEQYPKGMFAAAIYYFYVLLCMRAVKARLREQCLAIRFEDLHQDPQAVLRTIEAWSGHSLSHSRARLAAGDALDVGHIVTGNRLRRKGRVRFEPARRHDSQPTKPGVRAVAAVLDAWRRLLGF